jgi:hypothetical protein
MAIWNILWPFGIFYDHLVQFVFFWCIFSGFGTMHLEKSGNPGANHVTHRLGRPVAASLHLSESQVSFTKVDRTQLTLA